MKLKQPLKKTLDLKPKSKPPGPQTVPVRLEPPVKETERQINRAACRQAWLEVTADTSSLLSQLTTLCGAALPADEIERAGACSVKLLALFRQAAKCLSAACLDGPGQRLVKLESPDKVIAACLRCLIFRAHVLANANGLCEAAEQAGEKQALKLLRQASELARVSFADYLCHVVREYPGIMSDPEFAARRDWWDLLQAAKAETGRPTPVKK